MNLLDENIAGAQRELLRKWGVAVRHIGRDSGSAGTKDDGIIPLLHEMARVTFFTLDVNFYKRRLRHNSYCLVFMDVEDDEAARYARRVLRHPDFNTEAKRMGTVIRAEPSGLTVWQLHAEQEERVPWPQ